MRTPEGQDLIKQLSGKTDILAENFRPGTMERWNLGYNKLDGIVQDWVGQFDATTVLAKLETAEVPSSLVYSMQDLFEDPHIRARENIIEFPNPLGGLLNMVGVMPKLSLTPGKIDSTGPIEVGSHNEEIYCGRLGLSLDDLSALKSRGIV